MNSLSVFSGEEERRQAHEALEAQEAELARYAEQVAADQQQAAALQAKIKAMEEKARAPFVNPSCCVVFCASVCADNDVDNHCHIQCLAKKQGLPISSMSCAPVLFDFKLSVCKATQPWRKGMTPASYVLLAQCHLFLG